MRRLGRTVRARFVGAGGSLHLVEPGAERLEHADAARGLADAELDGALMVHCPAPATMVSATWASNVSFLVEHGRDAALGVLRVRLVTGALGDDDDLAVGRCLEGEREPGDPAYR